MKKIKKVILNGIEFDSQLEADHYSYLKAHPNIEIVNVHNTFTLFEAFEWIDMSNGKPVKKKARQMEYTVDFIVRVKGIDRLFAIETKGYKRKDYMMRKKLFLKLYSDYYFLEIVDKVKNKDHISSIFDKYR